MISMKKTAIAAALGLGLVAGAAQAAPVVNFNFTGAFVMYDGSGYDPNNLVTGSVVDNGNGAAGDPISGTMTMDYGTGAGSATIVPGALFFGSAWAAHNVTLQALNNMGLVQADMLFDWGDPAATSCGVQNCDIGVTVTFQMMPTANPGEYSFSTVTSSMPGGPFAGFQPTFNGTAQAQPSAVPVPAAAWLLGSGLLGLVGVARRKAA